MSLGVFGGGFQPDWLWRLSAAGGRLHDFKTMRELNPAGREEFCQGWIYGGGSCPTAGSGHAEVGGIPVLSVDQPKLCGRLRFRHI